MAYQGAQPTIVHPKYLLIGVQSPSNHTQDIDSYFQEFISLAKSAGVVEYEFISLKLREIDPKYYFTKGKLQELIDLKNSVQPYEIIVSEQLSPQQERHLKDAFECEVADRTGLILHIFEINAASSEGKTQVEIARLEFQKTRLAGHGLHLAQQAGQIGVKGPGETLKEQTTRFIEDNILKLKRRLAKLQVARDTQRKQRMNNHTLQISLVGYTNAGKSTILNTLTNSDVLAQDKLFVTLDTTTRQLFVDHTKIGVLADTVGFVQNLPHQLIQAFKSTLSELKYADLLLHVVDISNNNWRSHISVVIATLEEIGVQKDVVFVFNKADKLEQEELDGRLASFGLYAPYVVVNSLQKDTITPLAQYISTWAQAKKQK